MDVIWNKTTESLASCVFAVISHVKLQQSAECSSGLHTQTIKLSDKSQEGSFLEMKQNLSLDTGIR